MLRIPAELNIDPPGFPPRQHQRQEHRIGDGHTGWRERYRGTQGVDEVPDQVCRQPPGAVDRGDPDVPDAVDHLCRRKVAIAAGNDRHLVPGRAVGAGEQQVNLFDRAAEDRRDRQEWAEDDRDMHLHPERL